MLAPTDVYAAPREDDLRVAQLRKGGMRIDPLRTSPRPREELRTFSSP
jgi:hypothetical protein